MKFLESLLNGVLVGSTGYALTAIKPTEYPYAFTSCLIGLGHGLVGLYLSITELSKEEVPAKRITDCLMEIATVPLTNIELYFKSGQSNQLALGHGLFIVPLAADAACKIFSDDSDNATETLKDLTILGNIVSLVFLSLNEDNLVFGIMALSAFYSKYGAIMMEGMLKGTGEASSLIGYSLFFGLMPSAIFGTTPAILS